MFSVFILFMISCRCTILDVKFSFLYATVHSGENAIFSNVNRWVDKYVIMRRQCELRTDCRKNTKFNNCVTHTKQLFKIQRGFEQTPLQYFFCFVSFSLGCFAFYLPLIFSPLSSFWVSFHLLRSYFWFWYHLCCFLLMSMHRPLWNEYCGLGFSSQNSIHK